MPELPIDALLTGLDDTIEPDAAFDARLRRLLAAELEPPAPAAGPESQTPLEVLELEATGTTENPASRWRLAAAAAAVIGVVLVAVVLLRDGDGGTAPIVDDPAVSVIGTERTFAGAELDSTTIAEGGNPYWVAAGADLLVVSLEGDLTRLDPTNLVPTGTLQLSESSPVAVGAGAVWVADALSGTVKRIDPAAMQVSATIPTGI
ncbi:MAG: hypothetical protein OES57_10010, partial [Acidimicrobiia bacterium]|nr:hypothetical protein [Acidimicrobiia bacterium]